MKKMIFVFGLVFGLFGIAHVFSQSGLDANGLRPDQYNAQGWALVNGKWVPSPDGALSSGEEHLNLAFLIAPVVNRMEYTEKGLLKAFLLHGKNAEKELGEIMNSPELLAYYGKEVNGEWVAEMLDKAFSSGFGFIDSRKGRTSNYGRQLDYTINNHVVKSLKLSVPVFTHNAETVGGAIERENWLAGQVVDQFVANMPEADRLELAKHIMEELRREGHDFGPDFAKAFAAGGMAMVWQKGGMKPYIWLAKTTKIIGDFLIGKPLPFVVYKTLSIAAKVVFKYLLPGVAIGLTAKMLFDLPGIINTRAYDKFIPAVLIIGLSRLSQEGNTYLP